MIIKQLNLDHFGKFHDTEIDLEPGINVISGANESGKSTVHSFIQCMLFGAERLRGRGSGRDIYTRYRPWDGSGSYEGRMSFEYQGKTWRIVRNFHKEDASFALIDETTGRQMQQDSDDISGLIDGLNLTNYRNSISSGQLAAQPDASFTASMQSYMANMALGANASVDVSGALAYLKDERKKASAKISNEAASELQDKAETIRGKLEGRAVLQTQQEALEEEKCKLQTKIRQTEAQTDEAMKQDRKERMRAIQLIQENNDVAAMYKAKKAELREMEASNGAGNYERKIQEVMAEYENRQAKLEDMRSRYSELEEQSSGNGMRNLALVFPLVAAALIVWLCGSLFGLEGIVKIAVSVVLVLAAILLGVALSGSSSKKKSRMKQLKKQAEEMEAQQKATLKKYGINNINQLREKGRNQQTRQDAVVRLRREMEELKEKYNSLQGPLQPYLDKYGDSVTLESEVGQEEKREIEQLRRQLADVSRRAEQLEWRMEQLNGLEAELADIGEQLGELRSDKKDVDEDLQAIDISEKAIREITSQIHGSFGIQLADYVSQLLSYITDGAHQRLTIDEKFQIKVDDNRQLMQPQQLSAGTEDQIYFAVRMAATQLLFKEPMPLILDDSFALYDDQRLANVLTWLSEQDFFSQIIIFTCHHREAEILEHMGQDFHLVELSS